MSKQQDGVTHLPESPKKLSLAKGQDKTFSRVRESYITTDNDGVVMMMMMMMMMMTMFLLTKVMLMTTTSLCRLTRHGEAVQLLCGFVPVLTRQRYEILPSNDPHLRKEQNTNRIYIILTIITVSTMDGSFISFYARMSTLIDGKQTGCRR